MGAKEAFEKVVDDETTARRLNSTERILAALLLYAGTWIDVAGRPLLGLELPEVRGVEVYRRKRRGVRYAIPVLGTIALANLVVHLRPGQFLIYRLDERTGRVDSEPTSAGREKFYGVDPREFELDDEDSVATVLEITANNIPDTLAEVRGVLKASAEKLKGG
jgi:hypothetical protein